MSRMHATTRRAATDRRPGCAWRELPSYARKANATKSWHSLLEMADEEGETAPYTVVDGEEEDEERRMRELDRAIQDATIETWCEAARGEVQDAGEAFLEETAREMALLG